MIPSTSSRPNARMVVLRMLPTAPSRSSAAAAVSSSGASTTATRS